MIRLLWLLNKIWPMSRIKEKKICRYCLKLFNPHRKSFGIYCSNRCQKDFEWKTVVEKWLRGEDNPINANGLLKPWARRYVFSVNQNKCKLCGWGEKNLSTGKVPLEIDHIDGNYRNNNFSNIRLLCPNCHALTSTYKALNKGNGRSGRVLR